MRKLYSLIMLTSLLGLCLISSCGDDENPTTVPTVVNAVADLSLFEGFGNETVDISNVFNDDSGGGLTYSVSSSSTNVATVNISGATLTISEQGNGSTTITLTASSSAGAVDDQFTVTIETCPSDNSTQQTTGMCFEDAEMNTYVESVNGDIRTITTNGLPNHSYTNSSSTATELNGDTKIYTLDATPAQNTGVTSIVQENGEPKYIFGVTVNGIKMDPAPATPFIFENTSTGEYNWDWVFEPTNNTQQVGLDCNLGHVQPDGSYHYHGDMAPLADILLSGLGTGTTVPTEAVQIGWAGDGFPILYKYGYDSNGNVAKLTSSYQIKSGSRDGDGVSEPCGEYNGKYINDYEYVEGAGDLDECNGISQSITIGGETFNYYYVITDDFPVIPRFFRGNPDDSFLLKG